MDITEVLILLIFGILIELKFSPRIELNKKEQTTDVILFYTIKDKFDSVNLREFLILLTFKNFN